VVIYCVTTGPVSKSRHKGVMIDAVCTSTQGPCNLKVNGIFEGTALFGLLRVSVNVWSYALLISMRTCWWVI
jgi:hypothetical protein